VQEWYWAEVKRHSNWPAAPYKVYRDNGWIDWSELVGKENFMKKMFLPFSDFQKEVNSFYPGDGDVQRWFKYERKKHPDWPAAPDRVYRNNGWTDWSGLVGRENHLKRTFLVFTDFRIEVTGLYPGVGDVQKWYFLERKKHSNWPSEPSQIYKETGWVGWPELVGKENPFKKDFLSFEDFKREVIGLFPGGGGIQKWFNLEQKNHPDWPSAPDQVYKENGWNSWLELAGKEKKIFLSFVDFQKEVRKLYPGKGDVHAWYSAEAKRHLNWPSAPYKTYKETGWAGWSELVGKENFLKREFLSFIDFRQEAKGLYPGKGDVQKWYFDERKNHSNWPSNPGHYYKDEGWTGWRELVS